MVSQLLEVLTSVLLDSSIYSPINSRVTNLFVLCDCPGESSIPKDLRW